VNFITIIFSFILLFINTRVKDVNGVWPCTMLVLWLVARVTIVSWQICLWYVVAKVFGQDLFVCELILYSSDLFCVFSFFCKVKASCTYCCVHKVSKLRVEPVALTHTHTHTQWRHLLDIVHRYPLLLNQVNYIFSRQ